MDAALPRYVLLTNKSPAGHPAGLFDAGRRRLFVPLRRLRADIEKLKLSKVFSATRNHQVLVSAEAFRLS